jgi:hypothetical protein
MDEISGRTTNVKGRSIFFRRKVRRKDGMTGSRSRDRFCVRLVGVRGCRGVEDLLRGDQGERKKRRISESGRDSRE